jgi:hypothetical protein
MIMDAMGPERMRKPLCCSTLLGPSQEAGEVKVNNQTALNHYAEMLPQKIA